MTATDDRPTIGERYSKATESGNLKLGERRGDVDYLIAAGLVLDGLASVLFRLQSEYSAHRAEHIAAETRLRLQNQFANHETGEDDETGETAEERAAKIREAAEHQALVAHMLILSQLGSLRRAKQLFGEFAVVEATRHRFMRPDFEARVLAGRVLEFWLSPNCRHCDGRGFTGGQPGVLQSFCRPCRGSGSRRDAIGKDSEQRGFVGHLLMQTDALMFLMQRDIRAALRRVENAKALIAEAEKS